MADGGISATVSLDSPMTASSVLALARKYVGTDGHQWSDAELLAGGLTPGEVTKFKANVVSTNGGPGWLENAVFLTQISYHESGFNPRAHGVGPVDDSYGLWQINTLGPLWASIQHKYGLTSKDQLYDPETNARIMGAYWKDASGNNTRPAALAFAPWKGNSYRKSLQDIASGTASLPTNQHQEGSAVGGVGSTDSNPLPNISGWMDALGSFFSILTDSTFWKRVGIGALGFGVIAAAFVIYNKDSIMSTATKAALA